MSDLRVTFVSSHSELGGAEGVLLSLIDDLGPRRVGCVVVPGEGPVAADARAGGHRVEVIPADGRTGILRAAFRLRRLVRRTRPRIVHANGARAAIVTALACVGTEADVIWLKVDGSRDGALARAIARRCRMVIGISHAVNQTFEGALAERTRVVYPGVPGYPVDRKAGRDLLDRATGTKGGDAIVVSGRLCPPKGQMDLIEAAPALLSERPGLRIVLLGGENAEYLGYEARLRERSRQLGVAGAVHMVGHRNELIGSTADAVRLVSGCDVLVAPSRYEPRSGWREGFGLAPVEAMLVGTPVVAYRHGSFPEVLGDCATLVEEGDRDGLAAAVLELLRDEELRRARSDCGRDRVSMRFRRGDAVAAIERCYSEIAGVSSSP